MKKFLPNRYYNLSQPLVTLTPKQQLSLNKFRQELKEAEYKFESALCICGQKEGILIAKRDRYALSVDTYICHDCGTMWTNPRMDSESLDRFYEKVYRSIYVGEIQASDDFFSAQIQQGKSILEYVYTNVQSDESRVVFDIGCGAGGILLPFKEKGWSAYGCDIGGEYLDRGRQAGLVLEQGGAESLKQYGKANLVILSHVLEHLPNPSVALQEIASLLTDNGLLYIELPGIFYIHKTYRDLLLFLQNAHLYHFTLTTLQALLTRHGFELVKGDEYIHALFKKKKDAINFLPSASVSYTRIMRYLYFVELLRISRLIKKTLLK